MNAKELDPRYRDPNRDTIVQRDPHDSRKPKITLAHLNRLKKMRAAKDLQELMRGDFMEIIYGSVSEPGAEGPGGGL